MDASEREALGACSGMMLHRLVALLIVLACCCITGLEASSLPDSGGLLFSGKVGEQWDLYFFTPGPTGTTEGAGTIRALTSTPQAEGNPVWWARHGVVLCSRQADDGRFVLAAIDPVNGSETWRSKEPMQAGNLGWPQPSPWDDRILAVLEDPATGFTRPGIVEFATGEFAPFPDLESGEPGGQPVWVDVDRVLLSRVHPQGFDLTERRLSTGEEKRLVQGGRNWLPAANPMGGGPFVFVRRVGQNSSIFQLSERISGSGNWTYENLTNARQYDWEPSISADGRWLAYQSMRNGTFKTVVRRLADGAETLVEFPGIAQIFHPSWVELPAAASFRR